MKSIVQVVARLSRNVDRSADRNKRRSRTAEYLFKNDARFWIRSAGLSEKSERKLTESDLHWADLIFVMESGQKNRITNTYRHLDLPKIEVLNIDDVYDYLDKELNDLLRDGINQSLKQVFGI